MKFYRSRYFFSLDFLFWLFSLFCFPLVVVAERYNICSVSTFTSPSGTYCRFVASTGEQIIVRAQYRDPDSYLDGNAVVSFGGSLSGQINVAAGQTSYLKSFVTQSNQGSSYIKYAINRPGENWNIYDYLDLEVYSDRTNLAVSAPYINSSNGNLFLPHRVTTNTPFSPGSVWVSLKIWATNQYSMITQPQYPLLGEWGLKNCVNKSNCSDTITIPFSQRKPIPRGLSYLRFDLNSSASWAETTRNDNTIKTYLDDFFSEQVPDIMANHASTWSVAKTNLNFWIDNGVAIKNTSVSGFDWNLSSRETVSTSWFLDPQNTSNNKVNDAFKKLIQPTYFDTTVTRDIIAQRVRQKFKSNPSVTLVNVSTAYGSGISIKDYHNQQVTYIVAQTGGPYATATPDGVTAAFGGFSFYLVPLGQAFPSSNNQYKITISAVAVHVMDSFDFSGTQPLGCWKAPNVFSPVYVSGLNCVSNSSFRWYRFMKARGLDYNLFAPPKIVYIMPYTFYVSR